VIHGLKLVTGCTRARVCDAHAVEWLCGRRGQRTAGEGDDEGESGHEETHGGVQDASGEDRPRYSYSRLGSSADHEFDRARMIVA